MFVRFRKSQTAGSGRDTRPMALQKSNARPATVACAGDRAAAIGAVVGQLVPARKQRPSNPIASRSY
jgi:hypothetical protein